MKVSTKGRYGLTVMTELAANFGEGPISLKVIAEKHNLSGHYLEQLIAPLRNASLVKSVRGAYGGYILSREPKNITVGDVIRVLEGPIEPVDFSPDEEPARKELWIRIRESITEVLDSTTLLDLASYKKDDNDYMFYI
jgi:Rrf2 family cysteine metabolism transcriptional repressor